MNPSRLCWSNYYTPAARQATGGSCNVDCTRYFRIYRLRLRQPRQLAVKIIEKNADYFLALKANQGTFAEDVDVFAQEQQAWKDKDTTISTDETVDAGHGRIEMRGL